MPLIHAIFSPAAIGAAPTLILVGMTATFVVGLLWVGLTNRRRG